MTIPTLTRREILARSGLGLGALALAALLEDDARADQRRRHDLTPKEPHFAPRARSVIMLMQNGGPGQMDLFDEKPALARLDGTKHETTLETFQRGSEAHKLLRAPFAFRAWGKCGMQLAEVIPHIGSIADDLCLVRSMYSEHNNHTEALVMMNTGRIFPGRPALGSWISYALGAENGNLPAYIVLRDPAGYNTSGSLLWENAWLPAIYRGTEMSATGSPVLNLQPSRPEPAGVRRDKLGLIARLNALHRRAYPGESDLEARIMNYELAARMQLAASDVLDMSGESEETSRLYGLDSEATASYGLRCLLARRLVESGVRFVQIFPPAKPNFQPWDSHGDVKGENERICAKTDLPFAGLVTDLKRRGLLETTIVLWTGEFGRLPISQNGKGRDHNRNAFSLLLAGGGFRSGHVHGATDDIGYRAVEGRVGVPDLHATLLHQLGLDHDRVTFRHRGRDETLTDSTITRARVVREILV